MAPRNTYPIDWRRELKALRPFLNGKGGTVRIIYDGDDCAPREFREIIKSIFENKTDNRKWKSIRIDSEWYSTKLLADILHEFEQKLSDNGRSCRTEEAAANGLNFLAYNEFHEHTEISIENLSINTSDPLRQPQDRDKRV
jgi:hypothetical protein